MEATVKKATENQHSWVASLEGRVFLRALNIRSHERRPVVLLWLHSFCLGVGVAYLLSAALSIFLAAYSIEYLIGVFAIAALAEFVLANLAERLEKVFGQVKTLRWILVFLIAGTFIFWFLLRGPFPHSPGAASSLAVVFGLVVWARILIYVSDNAFWSLPHHFFDVRQSKRLYSLIDSGSFLASILGYFSIPLFTHFLAVPDLLVFSFLGTFGSLLVLQRILSEYSHLLQNAAHSTGAHHADHNTPALRNRSHNGNAESAPHENTGSLFTFLKRHHYLTSIIAVTFLTGMANTCVDYGFMSSIELRNKNIAQIAAFLGLFLGGAKMLSLLLKVGIVGRLFARFGLGRTSLVLPIALIVTTIAGLALPITGAQTAVIWSFTGCMLLMELWSDAVQKPALAVALQPLTSHERHLGHKTIDSLIEPLTLFFAAVLLYLLSLSVGIALRGVSVTLLAVFVAWAFAILVFDKEYKSYLLRALKHRRLRPSEFAWDEATRTTIASKLRGRNNAEAAYALRLIPAKESMFFLDALPELLREQDPMLQVAALDRFEEFEFSEQDREKAETILKEMVKREDDPDLLGHALYDLALTQKEFHRELWEEWLRDERLPVREGILSGLIKFKGTEGVLFSNKYVEAMQHSEMPHERAAVAEIVGRVGRRHYYEPLIPLLKDPDSTVRFASLRAAARVGHSELIAPLLTEYLKPSASRQVQKLVENSLRSFGGVLLPHLIQRIDHGHVDGVRLHRITRLLGDWSHSSSRVLQKDAVRLLTELLNWHQRGSPSELHSVTAASLRLAALREFVNHEIPFEHTNLLDDLIREELERAQGLLEILKLAEEIDVRRNAGADPATSLLQGAISFEVAQGVERILLLLSLRFDAQTLKEVRDTLLLGDKRHRANAYETLDHILPSSIAVPLVMLIETRALLHTIVHHGKANIPESDHVALTDLLETMPTGGPAPNTLVRLIQNEDHFLEPWTIATARYWQNVFENKQAEFSTEELSMPLPFERVILLKSVDLFRETPDPILGHLAQAMEEVHIVPGQQIIEKGDFGNCLYIIVEGRVRIHDDDVELAILSNHDVVGELSVLDPEPRSASVTAIEETTLLRLDYEVFYDLMIDNIEIARGAIAMLCRRIRNQNAVVSSRHYPSAESLELLPLIASGGEPKEL